MWRMLPERHRRLLHGGVRVRIPAELLPTVAPAGPWFLNLDHPARGAS